MIAEDDSPTSTMARQAGVEKAIECGGTTEGYIDPFGGNLPNPEVRKNYVYRYISSPNH